MKDQIIQIIRESDFEFELHESPMLILDELDFVEVVMEVEREFDVVIDEGVLIPQDFKTMEELVNWLTSFVNEKGTKKENQGV